MKKWLRYILIFSVLFLSIQIPASAQTNSVHDSLVPSSEKKNIGDLELLYNKYPISNYYLDLYINTDDNWVPWNWKETAMEPVNAAIHSITQAVWSINIMIANLTGYVVEQAFKLDFVSSVINQIAKSIQSIAGFGPGGFKSNGLWPGLIILIIAMVGAWATYVGILKKETSRAWGSLISFITIFVLSLGFFSQAHYFLKGINSWSSNIQSSVLSVSMGIVTPGKSFNKEQGVASVRNQIHEIMVTKPYSIAQYGTTNVSSKRMNELLKVNPYVDAEKRRDIVKNEVESKNNSMMSVDGISQRLAFVPLLFMSNTIMGLMLILMSAIMIFYQVFFIVLALFSPVPLIISLVPAWSQTAVNWLGKLIHAQLMKIVVGLVLTILFSVSSILYASSSNMGFLFAQLVQIIIFIGIFLKRHELLTIMANTAVNPSMLENTIDKYKHRFLNNVRNRVINKKDGMNSDLKTNNLSDRNRSLNSSKDRNAINTNSIQGDDKNNVKDHLAERSLSPSSINDVIDRKSGGKVDSSGINSNRQIDNKQETDTNSNISNVTVDRSEIKADSKESGIMANSTSKGEHKQIDNQISRHQDGNVANSTSKGGPKQIANPISNNRNGLNKDRISNKKLVSVDRRNLDNNMSQLDNMANRSNINHAVREGAATVERAKAINSHSSNEGAINQSLSHSTVTRDATGGTKHISGVNNRSESVNNSINRSPLNNNNVTDKSINEPKNRKIQMTEKSIDSQSVKKVMTTSSKSDTKIQRKKEAISKPK